MPTEQQVNLIARKFANILLEAGYKMMKSAFRLEPKEIEGSAFYYFLLSKTSGVNHILLDGKYYLIPFSQWLDIINVDWINLRPWITEVFDCDDHAFAFSSHISEMFDINSKGAVYGRVLNKDTGKEVGWHYWNAIVSKEQDGSLHLYYYEPGTDQYAEDKGGKIIIGNWIYEPKSIQWF